ncbi:hypothetical protein Aple_003130 [Acrocarpospora pleiomorpha]|uniref:Uncharacterized protein n=1 Tax=Acrocarpospora pleiomorpha TaxID=90975 RepID=A0A5M3XH68_9ACTN|nr:hypothetical protein Aple_003130 [Acrocarpospora pleiomorpha]
MISGTSFWTVGEGTAPVGERPAGVQPMQVGRVLEQGDWAVERTALVNHAHRPEEDSILFVMRATVPTSRSHDLDVASPE